MNTETIKVRFVRKPCSIEEVLHNADPDQTASQVVIEKHVVLSSAEYDEFGKNLLADRTWLQGLGGWINREVRNAVLVTAPERMRLFVDPSGSAYGRYVGVDTEVLKPIEDQASAIRWLLNNRRPEISIDQALHTLRVALCGDRNAMKLLDQLATEN